MPKVFRVMKCDEANRPAIGESSTALGVRIPKDIAPGESGIVHPNTGGMPESPNLESLPPHMIPERLRYSGFKRASGRNSGFVWRMGEGDFEANAISVSLHFRPDPDKPSQHGLVEPSEAMTLERYREALRRTQTHWIVDEPEEI